MMFRSFVRPLFVALSLAFATTAAAPAFAEGNGDAKATESKGHGKDKKRGKVKLDEKFPMPAEKFSKSVETRITKAREKLGAALTKHSVADAKKTEILKEFDTGAATVREAAKTAGKDGSVTKDEAKSVRSSAKALKKQLKNKYLPRKKGNKPVAKDV